MNGELRGAEDGDCSVEAVGDGKSRQVGVLDALQLRAGACHAVRADLECPLAMAP